ncbi:bleomycin resistance protein [Xanthomonas campestris]|uniref:bleomycin resistance protein n=1 Tax=Xanthomonas campestris TaxID=339 RepID=UPI003CF31F77
MVTQTVTPVLRVTSASASFPFYVQGLGFTVDWEYRHEPDFPVFAQLTRGDQTIFLTEHADDCQVGGAVYFAVPDVDECNQAFQAAELVQSGAPHNTAWKTREILVTDPDGNRLTFFTELAA